MAGIDLPDLPLNLLRPGCFDPFVRFTDVERSLSVCPRRDLMNGLLPVQMPGGACRSYRVAYSNASRRFMKCSPMLHQMIRAAYSNAPRRLVKCSPVLTQMLGGQIQMLPEQIQMPAGHLPRRNSGYE